MYTAGDAKNLIRGAEFTLNVIGKMCYALKKCVMCSNWIKFDPLCLHWSCFSSTVNSRRTATPIQAKWIKLDLCSNVDISKLITH